MKKLFTRWECNGMKPSANGLVTCTEKQDTPGPRPEGWTSHIVQGTDEGKVLYHVCGDCTRRVLELFHGGEVLRK